MSQPESAPIYTVGYGSRSLEELVELLQGHRIACLVDIRSAPYSRHRPEFSRPSLEAALPGHGLRYVFQGAALGGRPEAPECYVDGRLDYDRLRRQEFYLKGIDRLRRAHAQGMRVALLCAEGRPEECHRARLVAPSLVELGIPVVHLDVDGTAVPHAELAARIDGGQPPLPGAAFEALREPETSQPAPEAGVDLGPAHAALRRVFGYDSFRPLQEAVISSALQGRDALAVMPTGAGKSLCYQLPALLFEGLTVVVSPLLSLMQDQVSQLRALGIPAVTLNSMLTYAEYAEHTRQVRSGAARLLYVAPETLVRPETAALLDEARVACLAVDEAHCISEWGHDFRPEYRQLRPLRARYPRAVCLAFTATATARVQEDIRRSLGIPAESTYVAGFDRPNLFLAVRRREDALAQVRELLAAHLDESGILYCSTREQVEQLVAQLGGVGVRAVPYHAGLPDAVRRENQRQFQHDEVPVVVATIAFGMGINKSNVRFVLHHTLPDCLETYYQQVGRAGRDGAPADCLLLFGRGDVGTIFHFIESGSPAERAGRGARLQAMLRYAEATGCRRAPLLSYFDDTPPAEPCGMCDNCLAEAAGRERVDVSEDARLYLGCVRDTGQRFGPTHLVDVLRGSASEKLRKWGHDRHPLHGRGRHRAAAEWRQLSDRFVELGLLDVEPEHHTLRLTPAGMRALEGEPVLVVQTHAPAAAAPRTGDVPHHPGLFAVLRALRREIAEAAGEPPYVVFSDRTLMELAGRLPRSEEELLCVHGVGSHKAAAYGERFLAAIRDYVAEHGLQPVAPAPGLASVPAASPRRGERSREVGTAFRKGASLEELQERWGVTRQTILDHLYAFALAGGPVDAERILPESALPEAERQRVLALFGELGAERLGPVFAALRGEIPYPELSLLRLYHVVRLLAGAQEARGEPAEEGS